MIGAEGVRLTASFGPIEASASIMSRFPQPWYVAGGWAIDLFVGRVTREHGDLEVAVFRRDQGALQAHMVGWTLFKVGRGSVEGQLVPWQAGERLELPIHQIVAQREQQ